MRTERHEESYVRCRNKLGETFQKCLPKIVGVVHQVFPPLVLLFVICKPVVTFAQGVQQHPLVRFTGILLPVEEKGRSGVRTLTVRITDATWIFRIATVENLMGSRDLGELRLFQMLFPPRVHFVGSEDLLRPLREPEVTGKRLAIEGILYPTDKMWVTAVEEIIPE